MSSPRIATSINGKVHQNPYYVDPVTYLQKLALRKGFEPLASSAHVH
jgi:hypothetical protein